MDLSSTPMKRWPISGSQRRAQPAGHQPRVAGEGSHQPIYSAGDSAHCGAGQRGSGGEVGGAVDSGGKFSHWRGVELLLCADLGTSGGGTFSGAASGGKEEV